MTKLGTKRGFLNFQLHFFPSGNVLRPARQGCRTFPELQQNTKLHIIYITFFLLVHFQQDYLFVTDTLVNLYESLNKIKYYINIIIGLILNDLLKNGKVPSCSIQRDLFCIKN